MSRAVMLSFCMHMLAITRIAGLNDSLSTGEGGINIFPVPFIKTTD